MTEVDHGARNAYEERVSPSERARRARQRAAACEAAPRLASLGAVKRGTLAALTCAALIVARAAAAAQAAAPANDAFAAATPLAVGEEISGSNVDATAETGEPDPTGFAASETCANIAAGRELRHLGLVHVPARLLRPVHDRDLRRRHRLLQHRRRLHGRTRVPDPSRRQRPGPAVRRASGNNLAGTQVTFAATAGTVYHVDVTGHGGAQGSFYLQGLLRTGDKRRPRPTPRWISDASFASAVNALSAAPAVTSGPRRSGSFALALRRHPARHSNARSTAPRSPPATRRSPTTASRRAPRTCSAPARWRAALTDATPAVAALHDRHDAARDRPAQRPDRSARQPDGDLDQRRLRAQQPRASSPAASTACRRWPAAIPSPSASSARARTASTRRRWTMRRTSTRRRLNAAIQVTTGTACAAPTVSPSSSVGDRRRPARCCSSPTTTRAPAGACTSNTARRPPTGWK